MIKKETSNNYVYPTQGLSFPPNVTISRIDIAFFDLIIFLIKLAIASIPAGIILLMFYGLLTGFLGLLGLSALINAIF